MQGVDADRAAADVLGARRAQRLGVLGVLGISLSFAVFASQYVVRATNNLWGDVAFSGWSAALGHRLTAGESIYRDFAVPLPPGSFLVLSWLERLSGSRGPSVLLEGRVCAACHVAMGLLAYAIARPLVGRANALLTSAGTLAWICGWPKELAYDHLAEVCAWSAMALLVRAWTSESSDRARRWLFQAGLLSGATLLFKQSTAFGIVAAGVVGIAYLAHVKRGERPLRHAAIEARAYVSGALAGCAVSVATVSLAGGSTLGFLRAVFVDAPALKGGTATLATRAVIGAASEPMAAFSLASFALFAGLATRIVARTGFVIGRDGGAVPDDGPDLLSARDVAWTVSCTVVAFGGGATALAVGARTIPAIFGGLTLLSILVVETSACLAVAFFFGNARAHLDHRARAYNASALAALTLATAVSSSLTSYRPLDENNVTIVIVLSALFAGLRSAGFDRLRWAALAVVLCAPLGSKLPRDLMATFRVGERGFFRGMLVNRDGVDVVRAANRARWLARARGTVLVLPEDPSLVALIGRPRPALCGGVVFPDQYPGRCLEKDLTHLGSHLPSVLVTRPTASEDWRPVFRQWTAFSPAEALVTRFLDAHKKDYERDSTYRTRWGDRWTALDIWVARAARP